MKINLAGSILLVAFMVSFSTVAAMAQTGIEGTWKEPKNGGVIKIFEEDGKYYGQLIATEDKEQTKKIESHGKVILLRDFEKEGANKFCCGTIYQPKKEKTLSASLVLEDENTLKIKAKMGIFSGTQTWTRM